MHRGGRVVDAERDDAPGSRLRVEGPTDEWKHGPTERDRREMKSRGVKFKPKCFCRWAFGE